MGDFKYQLLTYGLFDYAGVERHLGKMAAKGWQLDSVGSFFWKYKKAEPAALKYSVTYVPEASEFDPEPLEKQKDIEAYCKEAGWKKVGTWMQMQIFCSEHPAAVPIETDEELRLEGIGKSMKKNFLVSHTLLLAVFLLNMFSTLSTARRDWVDFLSDNSKLWNSALWLWGIILLASDFAFYAIWMRRAKRAVKEGRSCPEPKGYRHWNRLAWCVLVVLVLGMYTSYSSGMVWFMVVYLVSISVIIFGVCNLQKKLKKKGVSKEGNIVATVGLSVILSLVLMVGVVAVIMGFDIPLTKKHEPVDTILVNGREWKIYQDTLPLYINDFIPSESKSNSCKAREQSGILVEFGDYEEYLFDGKEVTSVTVANSYQVITVKAKFLYDFLLESVYEREFRHWDDEEKEKLEYRTVYENENGKVCRQYYNGGTDIAFVAYDWLVLTEDKIVSLQLYLDDLSNEQMEIILEIFKKE